MDYLCIDTSNLLYRLFYGAHGAGSWMDRVGAALMGLPPNLVRLTERFAPCSPVFLFDAPPYKRSGIYPDYKSGRETEADDERGEAKVSLKRATTRLGKEVLNAVGFVNIHARAGYEADDLCGAVRNGLADGDRCILVTGDRDVYQLLDHRCAVYDPQRDKFVTANSFRAEFGIEPKQWVDVKALAGCDTDGVAGCPGVAEKTAIKYVRNEIPTTHKIYADILGFTRCGGVTQNAELVELPFPGLGPITPVPQAAPDAAAWGRYYAAFGFPAPVDPRRSARG